DCDYSKLAHYFEFAHIYYKNSAFPKKKKRKLINTFDSESIFYNFFLSLFCSNMKSSLVYAIILVALYVLNVLYVVASANNVARDNSNEKGQKSLNNQDNMCISWNMLANHSLSQMWTCVQHPRGHTNVRKSSVQILNNESLHKSIRVLISIPNHQQIQSNENKYIKMSTMNISTCTSGILSKSYSLTYKSISQRLDLKYIFLNQKHSVFASTVVIVMTSIPASNGVCKWVGANRAFDKLFVTNCSSTTLVRTPNLAINNICSRSNSAFPLYRARIKKKLPFQIYTKSSAYIQAIVVNTRKFVMHQQFAIRQVIALSARNIFGTLFDALMLGSFFFFYYFFFKTTNKKNFDRSYDVAQKIKYGRHGQN
ncbi:hypothetical protein RFI_18403, partial [Reticulomyxa filosa]